MKEYWRYRRISEEVGELLTTAANDRSPGGMIGFGSVWLAAEMYARNEQAHMRHKARVGLIQALEWRIERMSSGQPLT